MSGPVLTVVGANTPTPSAPTPSQHVETLDLETEYDEILALARSPLPPLDEADGEAE